MSKKSSVGKYTSGEWTKLETCFEVKSDPIFWQCGVVKGGVRVATAVGIGREEAEANAHLIAAAPELLEACKEAVADYEAMQEITIENRIYHHLKKVIARAEGRV